MDQILVFVRHLLWIWILQNLFVKKPTGTVLNG